MSVPIPSKHAVFSFFSGAGFLDLGFEAAGFEVVFANEISKEFVEGYIHSREKMKLPLPRLGIACDSIDDHLDVKSSRKLTTQIADVRKTGQTVGFIGGPPCPDFSVGGKNRGKEGENGKLTRSYVELIIQQKPDWFIFENVKGLWRTKRHREFFDEMKEKLESAGYSVSAKLLNSIQFGAPQDRDRILMFGARKKIAGKKSPCVDTFEWDLGMEYPERTAFDFDWPSTNEFGKKPTKPKAPEHLMIEHWFNKNQVTTHPNANHCFTPRAALIRFQTLDEGDDSKKSFKRLHRYRYSPTACYGNNEVHIHPYKARRISVAEALSIQSLPINFELPNSMSLSAMFKTIGNGVPFLMANGIASSVMKFVK